ncbi:MAG: hypothetical protein AAF944_18055 [Bacteroidota bacterium]
MQVKYTPHYLRKLEELLSESDYILRYEKGNFKPGYCILRDTCLVIVNKYYTLEGKINCLLEIIRQLDIDPEKLSPKQQKLLVELLEIPDTV